MNKQEYVKRILEDIKKEFINNTLYGSPYAMEAGQETNDIVKITPKRLNEILNSDVTDVGYFYDEDGTDGGIIQRVACQFDKLLPENNDFDMRDYPSFWLKNEETDYYIFFIENWKDNKDEEE